MDLDSANTYSPNKAAKLANFVFLTVLALVLSFHAAPSIPKRERVKLGA